MNNSPTSPPNRQAFVSKLLKKPEEEAKQQESMVKTQQQDKEMNTCCFNIPKSTVEDFNNRKKQESMFQSNQQQYPNYQQQNFKQAKHFVNNEPFERSSKNSKDLPPTLKTAFDKLDVNIAANLNTRQDILENNKGTIINAIEATYPKLVKFGVEHEKALALMMQKDEAATHTLLENLCECVDGLIAFKVLKDMYNGRVEFTPLIRGTISVDFLTNFKLTANEMDHMLKDCEKNPDRYPAIFSQADKEAQKDYLAQSFKIGIDPFDSIETKPNKAPSFSSKAFDKHTLNEKPFDGGQEVVGVTKTHHENNQLALQEANMRHNGRLSVNKDNKPQNLIVIRNGQMNDIQTIASINSDSNDLIWKAVFADKIKLEEAFPNNDQADILFGDEYS